MGLVDLSAPRGCRGKVHVEAGRVRRPLRKDLATRRARLDGRLHLDQVLLHQTPEHWADEEDAENPAEERAVKGDGSVVFEDAAVTHSSSAHTHSSTGKGALTAANLMRSGSLTVTTPQSAAPI